MIDGGGLTLCPRGGHIEDFNRIRLSHNLLCNCRGRDKRLVVLLSEKEVAQLAVRLSGLHSNNCMA